MKTTLITKGETELTKDDILNAVSEFNKKEKGYLTRAIASYLADQLNVNVKKVEYDPSLSRAVAQVEGSTDGQIKPFGSRVKPKQERNNPGGHKRRFKGFFDTVKGIIREARKEKRKLLEFGELSKEIKGQFPDIEDWRIKGYLNDERQLKGVSWDGRKGVLTL